MTQHFFERGWIAIAADKEVWDKVIRILCFNMPSGVSSEIDEFLREHWIAERELREVAKSGHRT